MNNNPQDKNKMETKKVNIKEMILKLAEVELTESPVLSCMVNLNQPRQVAIRKIEKQAADVSVSLEAEEKSCFDEALADIISFLSNPDNAELRDGGIAVYARVGELPFFYSHPVGATLSTSIIVDELPHIYPLVETTDTYNRFVVVALTEKKARILETTIGAVTNEIMTERPELREKIGREWTRERYQNHKEDRQNRFIQSKISVLEELVSKNGHNHIILSGSPKEVSRFRKFLPQKLANMLLDVMNVNPKAGINPIIVEAIETFAISENEESLGRVNQLEAAIMKSGLGVVGEIGAMHAIEYGYADVLIISQDYSDDLIKEKLVRLAISRGIEIETVKESEKLKRLQGVGCLLKYKPSFGPDIIQVAS